MNKQKDSNRVILGDVLGHANDFPWSFSLYLPFDVAWKNDTPCAVLDTADLGEEAVPEHVMTTGLEYAMGMQSVQGIVANARAQKEEPSEDDLLSAFLHYYDNDAFIEIPRH